jgi:hypothetical protein
VIHAVDLQPEALDARYGPIDGRLVRGEDLCGVVERVGRVEADT